MVGPWWGKQVQTGTEQFCKGSEIYVELLNQKVENERSLHVNKHQDEKVTHVDDKKKKKILQNRTTKTKKQKKRGGEFLKNVDKIISKLS